MSLSKSTGDEPTSCRSPELLEDQITDFLSTVPPSTKDNGLSATLRHFMIESKRTVDDLALEARIVVDDLVAFRDRKAELILSAFDRLACALGLELRRRPPISSAEQSPPPPVSPDVEG